MSKRHHFFNMYLTTTVSMVLVLFVIGLEAITLLSTQNLIRQVKENVTLTIVLHDEADSAQVARLENLLQVASFVRTYTYVSKEDALQEHIVALGDDPTAFLGMNPLLASYEVNMDATYAQTDSIDGIKKKLDVFPCVSQVVYPKDVVALLDGQLNRISIVLVALASLLLLVALALLMNTIRLHIYSKRFLINTMKLVGATPYVICRPIIRKNMGLGLLAGVLALVVLAGGVYYCQQYFGIMLLPLTWQNIAWVCGVVLLTGLFITGIAAWFATRRYIRMKADDLYYV